MAVEKLSLDFQNSVIKLMLQEEKFAINCLTYLQPEYFDNKYLYWTFQKVNTYYSKYKKVPTFEYLEDQLKLVSQEERESYASSLNNIINKQINDESYIKDEMTDFIQTSEFKKMHKQEAELFNGEKYADAYSYVSEQIEKIKKISFVDDSYVKISDIDKILEDSKNNTDEYISFGIPLIEEELLGGIPKQSVTTILGSYNIGKSIVSINMAYHMAMKGRKVLYIFHEGRKNQVVIRFLSRITGIAYNAIKAGDYDEEGAKKVDAAKRLIEKFIRIREMRTVGVSVEDVYDYCKITMKEWKFDALIDDYGQKLFTKNKGLREVRHVIAHVWHVFDLMSAELNIAVVTAAQFNRDAVKMGRTGEKILRSDDVSECIQIAQISETILTINRSLDDESSDKMVICLDKCRDGRAGLLVECKTDFRRMKAFDERLGMNKAGWDTLQEDESAKK